MRKYIIIFIAILGVGTLSAQTLEDAYRYSTTTPGGTARTIGAGGAFGALGGDFGSISINPAGLAVYRSSELIFSPGFLTSKAESNLSGTSANEISQEDYFGFENIGLVINKNIVGSNLVTSNFSIGYNKIANFNQDIYFSGSNIGTITERWVQFADGLAPEELYVFEEELAYKTGAIFDFDEDLFYNTDFDLAPDLSIRKNQFVERRGGINEISFSWAGNYNNKFNMGFGVGIPFISYKEQKTYREEDPASEIDFFNELEFYEFLNTTGTGINLKGGFIYTPARTLRVGLAVHSPTWYALTDDWFSELTYDYTDDDGNQRFTEGSPDGNFQYRLKTPWKTIFSVASLFKAGDIQGFVSGDVEYRDYSANNFNLSSNSTSSIDRENEEIINGEINEFLGSSLQFRLGTELAYQKIRVRAGLQLDQSPFISDDGSYSKAYSAGIGYRGDRFFIDMAYSILDTGESFYAYTSSDASRDPFVFSDITRNNLVFTTGIKF